MACGEAQRLLQNTLLVSRNCKVHGLQPEGPHDRQVALCELSALGDVTKVPGSLDVSEQETWGLTIVGVEAAAGPVLGRPSLSGWECYSS